MKASVEPQIPQFFAIQNDAYVLKEILKHYLGGTLAQTQTLTTTRQQMENWKVENHE